MPSSTGPGDVLETVDFAPVFGLQKNPVNVSFVLLGIDGLDESNGVLNAYVDLRMSWYDGRWSDAVDAWYHQTCTSSTQANLPQMCQDPMLALKTKYDLLSGSLFGVGRRYHEGAQNLQKRLHPSGTPKVPWTPVPKELYPKTADNPHSITMVDVVMGCTPWIDPALQIAMWFDTGVTSFDVNLDYASFPFDHQVLDLCLHFDVFTDPNLQTHFVDYLNGTSSLSSLDEKTERGYKASSFSPHVTQHAVDKFYSKGFIVEAVSTAKKQDGYFHGLCLKVEMRRKTQLIIFRLFGPLGMLLVIPFAGFWLSVDKVMPRVATGFISFLGLQVFRTVAYNMVPQKSSSFLWIDVTMFCITEIMFLCVMQNVFAQALWNRVSSVASRKMDLLARSVFPFSSATTLIILFAMGILRQEPDTIMIVSQVNILGGMLFTMVMMARFLKHLPRILLKKLIHEMKDQRLLWQDGLGLDPNELSAIFRFIDSDCSGRVTLDEVLKTFGNHGLNWQEEEMAHFREKVRKLSATKDANLEMDLDHFRSYFKELFGGKLVRHMNRRMTQIRVDSMQKKDDEPQPSVPDKKLDAVPKDPVPSHPKSADSQLTCRSAGHADL
jgi:hypothetical protein